MDKCPTCKQWIKDHRFDLIVQIAKSCEILRKFDREEKKIYPDYDQDNTIAYLDTMKTLHDLTQEEISFIIKF